jgi:hypothetical protein
MEEITGSIFITLMKTRVQHYRFKSFSKASTISDVFCYIADSVVIPTYMQMFCGLGTAPSHVV